MATIKEIGAAQGAADKASKGAADAAAESWLAIIAVPKAGEPLGEDLLKEAVADWRAGYCEASGADPSTLNSRATQVAAMLKLGTVKLGNMTGLHIALKVREENKREVTVGTGELKKDGTEKTRKAKALPGQFRELAYNTALWVEKREAGPNKGKTLAEKEWKDLFATLAPKPKGMAEEWAALGKAFERFVGKVGQTPGAAKKVAPDTARKLVEMQALLTNSNPFAENVAAAKTAAEIFGVK